MAIGKEKQGWLITVVVFLGFLALYTATAQHGVSWQDSGKLQYRILAGDYRWCEGIALAHPLYILLARGFVWLFPKAACFYTMNLLSGVGLALALTVLFYNVRRLTRSTWAAVMAVSVLGFAHMAWWLGTIAEGYTWSLAFVMAEVLCLIRYAERRDSRWLVALFAVNGAHWSLHNIALLGLPVYAAVLACDVWRKKGKNLGIVGACGVLWLLGGSLVLWQAATLLSGGDALVDVVKSVLFGGGYERQVLGLGRVDGKLWLMNLALVGLSFLNPCWLFAAGGLAARGECRQQPFRRWLIALTLVHGLFWVRYFIADQATFVLPTLGLLAIWVGIGVKTSLFDGQIRTKRAIQWLVVGVVCAAAAPWVLCEVTQRVGLTVSRSRDLPFRDEMRYWLVPWKQNEVSAERFVMEVGKQLRQGDILVADTTAASPLLAARAAGHVQGTWRLVTPWSGEAEADLRILLHDMSIRLFVVSPVPGYVPSVFLDEPLKYEREGVLYRIVAR